MYHGKGKFYDGKRISILFYKLRKKHIIFNNLLMISNWYYYEISQRNLFTQYVNVYSALFPTRFVCTRNSYKTDSERVCGMTPPTALQGLGQELEMGGCKINGRGVWGPLKAQRGVHMYLWHPPGYGLAINTTRLCLLYQWSGNHLDKMINKHIGI